jgi:hypothetical protein
LSLEWSKEDLNHGVEIIQISGYHGYVSANANGSAARRWISLRISQPCHDM